MGRKLHGVSHSLPPYHPFLPPPSSLGPQRQPNNQPTQALQRRLPGRLPNDRNDHSRRGHPRLQKGLHSEPTLALRRLRPAHLLPRQRSRVRKTTRTLQQRPLRVPMGRSHLRHGRAQPTPPRHAVRSRRDPHTPAQSPDRDGPSRERAAREMGRREAGKGCTC